MLAVMIIPTGIGCEIGGHSGDANAAAQLLGAAVDTLVLHPNVVNGSDINEMPKNALYVEGSALDLFLNRKLSLCPVKSNRILVVCNEATPDTVNSVSAARAILGVEAEILELTRPLKMQGYVEDGWATGTINGLHEMMRQMEPHLCNTDGLLFDVIAIHTPVYVETATIKDYFENGGINPWGGVEAMLSKLVRGEFNLPIAHAPTEVLPEASDIIPPMITDPRIAAETFSSGHLYCVLKGLHKAPRLSINGPSTDQLIYGHQVDALISPMCWGPPHEICEEFNIPIIFVKENLTHSILPKASSNWIFVNTYLEAAGLLLAMREGISRESITRPLPPTKIYRE